MMHLGPRLCSSLMIAAIFYFSNANGVYDWKYSALDLDRLNDFDDCGWTQLMTACTWGEMSKVKALVEAGADVNLATKKEGRTPLHGASYNGHADIAKLLIDAGADVNIADANGGLTPLHDAVIAGTLENCRVLLDAEADINAASKQMQCGLHWAALFAYFDKVDLLVKRGARTDSPDAWGSTPLKKARQALESRRVASVHDDLERGMTHSQEVNLNNIVALLDKHKDEV